MQRIDKTGGGVEHAISEPLQAFAQVVGPNLYSRYLFPATATTQLTARSNNTTLAAETDFMQAETAAGPIRLESRVRRLHHRAIGFAVVIACAVVLAAAIVFWFVDVYVPAGELLEKNRKTLDRVPCSDQGCDVTAVAADFEFSGADYLVDKNTRFLLDSGPQTTCACL